MAQRDTPPPKKDVARALLLRGSVFVYLDPRAEGVVVPKWLAGQPQLVLQVGLDLPIPIPDLRVDDAGVLGTLSFNRAPFTCVVPWSAVFALWGDDGMGMVWAEDMPEEIAAEVEQAQRAERPPARTRGPRLRAIEGGASESPPKPARARADEERDEERADGDEAEEPEPQRRLPPYLRVIK